MATAWHETRHSYNPATRELYDGPDNWPKVLGKTEAELRAKWGPDKSNRWIYFEEKYGAQTLRGKRLGNKFLGDGELFAGRGLVQLTGRRNYERYRVKLTEHFKKLVPLDTQPDLACETEYSLFIIVDGMIEGEFTGHRLSEYIWEEVTDFFNARRTVNGTDDAQLLADRARRELKEMAA